MELCSQVVELLNEIQEQLFLAFYDDRVVKLVVPVLKKFVDGDYSYADYDYDLTNLMQFVGELQDVLMRLHPLARQINMEKEEEDRRKASLSGASDSDELPF